MDHEQILHRCFRCGFCKLPSDYADINCPSYLKYRFESFSPGGRMWLIRAWLDGKIQSSQRLQESLFSCATCNNCVMHCPFTKFRDQILQAFIAAKKEMVEQGFLPPKVRDYLTALYEHGNPYKKAQKNRAAWAKEGEAPKFCDQKYLLYVGDVCSFDSRGKEIARSVARLLTQLRVSFGILGQKEFSVGNEAKAMGESELFSHLAQNNIQSWTGLGVNKIITISPHSYSALRNDYPSLGGTYEVFHYTQLVADLLEQGYTPANSVSHPPLVATFHDPCYLGRHNQEYDSPRKILQSIPWIELTEMPRRKEDALCCGGGGGNFFTDLACSGPETSAKVRVQEAAATGANIIATCCPQCLIILQDAVTSMGLEHTLHVQDIAELIVNS